MSDVSSPADSLDDRHGETVGSVPMPPLPSGSPRLSIRVEGYEVMNELGRGGMGVVYKAQHLRLKRLVALKLLQPGGGLDAEDWAALQTRFRRETEALARLKHPHVVEIYDVGETAAGAPYFAMEFCPLGSLEDCLRQGPLPPMEAANAVQAVALGVQAAHEAKVVHRDLKPANVLRGDDGSFKVTDFGLARKLDEKGQTQTGAIFGTPSYMAPEQARGRGHEAGPTADVYALGAILYECLTGRPPFQAATIFDTLVQVANDEPVSLRQLNPKIPRDLETIALKCLQKDPSRRYSSAKEMADDLERYHQGQAIKARPVGAVERAVKWSRRRPAVAGLLTALAVLVLGAGTAITLLYRDAVEQARNALEARDKADKQRQQAEDNLDLAKKAVNETLDLARADPLFQHANMAEARRSLLRRALPFYQKFRSITPDDPRARAELADQFFRVGYIESEIGTAKAAHQAYQRSRDLWAQLVEEFPDNLTYQAALALALNNLGIQWAKDGDRKTALKTFEEARRMYKTLIAREPRVLWHRHQLAETMTNIGNLRSDSKDVQGATKAFLAAIDAHEKLVQKEPTADNYAGLAGALHNFGALLNESNKHADAIKIHTRARDIRRQLVKQVPGRVKYRSELAQTLANLGNALSATKKPAEALAVYAESRIVLEALVAEYPKVGEYRYELARTLFNLATAQKNPDDEIRLMQQAAGHLKKVTEADPSDINKQYRLARTSHKVGDLLSDRDRLREATTAYRDAIAAWRVLVKRSPKNVAYRNELAWSLNALGATTAEQNKITEALPLFQEADSLLRTLSEERPAQEDFRRRLATVASNLGSTWRDLKKYDQSLGAFDRVAAIWVQFLHDHPEESGYKVPLGKTRWNRARTLLEANRIEEALAELADAKAELGTQKGEAGRLFYNMGRVASLCAGAVHRKEGLPLARREQLEEKAGRLALSCLKQAQEAGLFAKDAIVAQLKKDRLLDAIRAREDFQQFLEKMDRKP